MKAFSLVFMFWISACYAQKETIDLNKYKNNKSFSWAAQSHTVGSHTFTLVNIKPKVPGDTTCISAIIIDKRKYVLFDIGNSGAPGGLVVPQKQPLGDGLIAFKASPVDGKTFIFLSTGKLVTLPGASAFVDTLGKCVYCVWENDKQYRLTVFNYQFMRIVIPTAVIAEPSQWFSTGMSYCFTTPQEKGYYTIDMITKSIAKADQPEGAPTPVSYLIDWGKMDPAACCNAQALKK